MKTSSNLDPTGDNTAVMQSPSTQKEASASPLSKKVRRISAVVEYNTTTSKFHLVEQIFGKEEQSQAGKKQEEMEKKIMAIFKKIESHSDSSAAAYAALSKSDLYSNVTEVARIPFKDEKGEYDLFVFFGIVIPDAPLSGVEGVTPVHLYYDEIVDSEDVTPMTKAAINACLEKRVFSIN